MREAVLVLQRTTSYCACWTPSSRSVVWTRLRNSTDCCCNVSVVRRYTANMIKFITSSRETLRHAARRNTVPQILEPGFCQPSSSHLGTQCTTNSAFQQKSIARRSRRRKTRCALFAVSRMLMSYAPTDADVSAPPHPRRSCHLQPSTRGLRVQSGY